MCLRSVHFVSSLRSGYYVHFAKLIHFDSLHSIPLPYISPTSAPHSFGGLVVPFHNPRSHSISLSGCNPHTNKSTHKQPVKLHFIPQRLFHYTPNPPMPLSNAFPMDYFSYCGESTPINAK